MKLTVKQSDFRPLLVSPRRVERSHAPAPPVGGPVGGIAKRLFDVILSTSAIVMLLPLFIGLVLLIKTQETGPVFYGHKRVGYGGRHFRCWKLRTMHSNGDEILRRHLAENSAARAEWLETRKLAKDPRVTPLGQVLRALSLDELPQFFNVMVGDMSLVGPRPVVQDELARYGSSARYYLRARPGVTGLWQISGRSETTYTRRVAFDRYYANRQSNILDFGVMLKTVPAVLASRGAY